ncbi:hypothetical protein AA313_de0204789 [Arthrobotrys entomopaga]|nr:hypothetical protein AA313_de0204789 [Arthrobotrys entomopaga]
MNQATILARIFFLLLLLVGVQGQGEVHSSEAFKGFGPVQNQNQPNGQSQLQASISESAEVGVPESHVPEDTATEDIIETKEIKDFSPEQLALNQEYIREWAKRARTDLKQRQLQKPHKPKDWNQLEGYYRNSVIISEEQWNVFMEAIEFNVPGGSAFETLVIAGRQLVTITDQMRILVNIMKQKKPRGLQKLDANFVPLTEKILGALDWVYNSRNLPPDPAEPRYWSFIGKGKTIDPTSPPTKKSLEMMIATAVRGDKINDTLVVSGTHIAAMWESSIAVQEAIWPFFTQMQELIQKQLNDFPGTKKESVKAKGAWGSPPGQGRQDVGYAQYLRNRYIEPSYFNIEAFPGLSADSKIVGPPWKNWAGSAHMTGELYVSYFKLLDKLYCGVLPLMSEMLGDLMLAADVFLGRVSITPEYNFAYPIHRYYNSWNWLEWLEQYPEWNIEEWYKRDGSHGFLPPPYAYRKPPRSGDRLWKDWDYWTEWREDNPLMEK